MDIMSIGKGKQQILDDFIPEAEIVFFGDKCQQGGNDFDIVHAVRQRENGSLSCRGTGKKHGEYYRLYNSNGYDWFNLYHIDYSGGTGGEKLAETLAILFMHNLM